MSNVQEWDELESFDLYQNKITCEVKDSDKTVGVLVNIAIYTCGDKIEASAVIAPLDCPENYKVCDFNRLRIISIEDF